MTVSHSVITITTAMPQWQVGPAGTRNTHVRALPWWCLCSLGGEVSAMDYAVFEQRRKSLLNTNG